MSQIVRTGLLGLGAGLFVHAVLRFTPQRHSGEKVFWEAGALDGGPKATIGLDDSDSLFFSVTSASGNKFSTTVQPPLRLDDEHWLVLWCGLQHFGDTTSRLIVALNGEIVAERRIESVIAIERWGEGQGEAPTRLGADLRGENNAAFELLELVVSQGIPLENLPKVLTAVFEKYKLGDHGQPFALKGNYGRP